MKVKSEQGKLKKNIIKKLKIKDFYENLTENLVPKILQTNSDVCVWIKVKKKTVQLCEKKLLDFW